jgi:hypothetical protein
MYTVRSVHLSVDNEDIHAQCTASHVHCTPPFIYPWTLRTFTHSAKQAMYTVCPPCIYRPWTLKTCTHSAQQAMYTVRPPCIYRPWTLKTCTHSAQQAMYSVHFTPPVHLSSVDVEDMHAQCTASHLHCTPPCIFPVALK